MAYKPAPSKPLLPEPTLRPGDRVLRCKRVGTVRCDSAVAKELVIVDWDGDPPTTTHAVRRDELYRLSLLEDIALAAQSVPKFKVGDRVWALEYSTTETPGSTLVSPHGRHQVTPVYERRLRATVVLVDAEVGLLRVLFDGSPVNMGYPLDSPLVTPFSVLDLLAESAACPRTEGS